MLCVCVCVHVCACVCVVINSLLMCVQWPHISLSSAQHSLLRCCGPPCFHPPPLCYHCPHSDWTDTMSQETGRPIEGLQITHRGHGRVSRFIQPITAADLLGVMIVIAGFDGYKCASWLLIWWRLNNLSFELKVLIRAAVLSIERCYESVMRQHLSLHLADLRAGLKCASVTPGGLKSQRSWYLLSDWYDIGI